MCSLKVCGAPDNTSGICIDSQCGGEGCNGTVSLSVAALDNAKNVTDHLTAATEDLQGVTRKVHYISMKSSEVFFFSVTNPFIYLSCFLCTAQEYCLPDAGCEEPGEAYTGESPEKETALSNQQ